MLCQTLLGLAFASLVVAQSPNVDYGDCLNACSGVDKVESCDTNDSANSTASADADLNCLCNVYEQVIPGACLSCINGYSAESAQELQDFLNECKNGTFADLGVTGSGSLPSATGSSGSAATTTGSSGSGATGSSSSTASASGTSHTSAGSINAVSAGLMFVILAAGAVVGA